MKHKLFSLLFAFIASTSMLFAESGTCGDNVTWDLTDSVLTISGTGAMNNYNYGLTPWYSIQQQIRKIIVSEGVTSIGKYSFSGCSKLLSVELPVGLVSIEESAFANCYYLSSINLPSTLTSIGTSSFSYCYKLSSLIISDNITSIGVGAFANCVGLKSITIGNGIQTIRNSTFYMCYNLDSVHIGSNVTTIGASSFSGVGQNAAIYIPSSVINIGDNAFYLARHIVYSGTATGSPWGAICLNGYEENNLIYSDDTKTNLLACYKSATGEITLPNSVTTIGNRAFCNCIHLTSVTIGNQITSLGDISFSGCSKLSSLYITALTPPILGLDVFNDCPSLSIYVPCDSKETYQAATSWSEYSSLVKSGLQYAISTIAQEGNGSIERSFTSNDCDEVVLSVVPKYGYHFTQWSDGITENPRTVYLTQDTTFSAEFAKNPYSVSTETSNGEWGVTKGDTTILYLDSVFISAASNYGYHFEQWNDGSTENPRTIVVMQDTTFTAEFAKNSYHVVTQPNNAGYGSTTGDTTALYKDSIAISAEAKYGYHFVKWSDESTINQRKIELTKDTTLTAIFAPNQYTISTQAEHGSIANGGKYDYNTQVTLIANADEHYHFVRWSDGEMNATRTITVTKDTTYVAIFEIDKFLIKFKDEDGTELKSDSVEYGVLPIAPTTPTKDSTAQYAYAFDVWSPTIAVVTDNAIYTATYTATLREYLVSFLDEDSSIISSKNYQYGQTPVAPTNPVKQATAEYTYTFAGWDKPINQVQGAQTYKATYSATKNSYTITWKSDKGSTIDQTTVEYGVVPTHIDAIKAATAEYTYTFAEWTPIVVAVTGDATYTATFDSIKNSYTITWQNEDGSLIDQTTVEYGLIPAHTEPAKLPTVEYTYTFAGWTPEVVAVIGDTTYRATFTATKNTYIITWQNEYGSTIDQTTVEYGVVPTHAEPTKQATAEYTYTFAGWYPNVVAVTGDTTYIATFDSIKNSYTITWQNEDGSLIDQTTVEYGLLPVHAEPAKLPTAEYTYTFAGWSPAVVSVTGDATYRAIFTAVKNKYLIIFRDDDGTELKRDSVEYGVLPIAPTAPSKESTAQYTYTFVGWMPEVAVVTQAATYTATYTSTLRSYVVTFLNEDSSVISMQTYKYGEIPTIPETPTKQATAEYTYTFAGWTPSVATVTEDVTYTATFIATKNKYLIVFQDEDGTELKSEQVEYGEMPVAPTAPSKPADSEYIYTFSGWTPEIVVVTKDATYIATYDATPVSEGFEDISLEGIAPRKVMIDGNVYILRGDKVYTLQGQEVK